MIRRLSILLLLTAVSAVAQVPYIETLEVRVHSVDVVVTDAQGKPVAGLGPDDFQLLEDGVEKPITNFSGFAPPSLPKPDGGGLQPAAPPPAEEPQPQRAPRKFIFYVDEMSLADPTRKKLEAELARLLDTTMQPGDEAMVLRPAQERKLAAPFSGDRAAVRRTLMEAIHAERWRADAPILREFRLLENEMRGAASHIAARVAARRWAGLVRSRVQQRLGQLRAVVNAAAEVEGRKVLVLVTESLPVEPGKEAFTAYTDVISVEAESTDGAFGEWRELPNHDSAVDWVNLQPLVDEIGRSAAMNGITIYSVQAEYGIGFLAPGGDIGATTSSRLRQTLGDTRRRNASEARINANNLSKMVEHMTTNTEGTLRSLADMTGGTWARGGLSLDNLVTGIATDVESYYSLGYRAGESVDRAHKIEVRVKGRPELRVRTRREVIRKSPQREMTDRVVATLLDPAEANELGIRLEHKQVGVAPDRQYKTVLVAARVPLSTLTFLPDGDTLKARFSVHYAVLGTESDFVSGVHGEQLVEIPASKYEEVKNQNWTYAVPLNLRPAKHTVALGVLDLQSHLSGFARVELDLK
ncbi:MAG TPA: VWA domain-containing protein [Thermoanaerobaculia bacterium]|nr:VWA domain-containing protein [Thermoanaerobaculia bacterium]